MPALAWAQAEPAPPGYVPPGHHEPEEPPPSPLKWHVSANARLAVALGTVPAELASVGYGGGIQLTRALVDFGRMRFGVGADFAYQRIPHSTDDFLSDMTFAALLVLDGIFGRVRPWLTAGAGLAVDEYRKPANPMTMALAIDANAVVPLVQLALGLDVADLAQRRHRRRRRARPHLLVAERGLAADTGVPARALLRAARRRLPLLGARR